MAAEISIGGKEKLLAFGSYPETTLLQARNKQEEALAILKAGRDPGAEHKAAKLKQDQKAQNTFKVTALALIDEIAEKRRWSEIHQKRAIRRLEINVFPALENRPFSEIEPPELLAVLRKIEDRGAHETAARTRCYAHRFFDSESATGNATGMPPQIAKECSRRPYRKT